MLLKSNLKLTFFKLLFSNIADKPMRRKILIIDNRFLGFDLKSLSNTEVILPTVLFRQVYAVVYKLYGMVHIIIIYPVTVY